MPTNVLLWTMCGVLAITAFYFWFGRKKPEGEAQK